MHPSAHGFALTGDGAREESDNGLQEADETGAALAVVAGAAGAAGAGACAEQATSALVMSKIIPERRTRPLYPETRRSP